MKIVIVMTYYNRLYQLKKTLKSIEESAYYDFEVIIVDDGSEHPIESLSYNYPITILTEGKKNWCCSSVAYNKGIYYAMLQNPDVIIIQNAECYHVGDVISRVAQIKEDEYLTFGCYSINKDTTFRDHSINAIILNNNTGASRDGQNAWYNHIKYRPVYYHFCAALTANNMRKLNGFEERLMEGIGYEDDNFLNRIRLFGLNIEIISNPFVVHQWHYSNEIENKAQLVAKNKAIYLELLKEKQIQAQHNYTLDL